MSPLAPIKAYLRRRKLEAIFSKLRLAQGNQSHDSSTSNGSEACTHVAWCQAVIYLFTGILETIDTISKIAGYKQGDVGMNSTHVDRIIAHYRLPYVASWRTRNPRTGNVGDWSANDLSKLAREMAPVMVAVPYGQYPLAKRLGNVGPNGNAKQGGRTDLNFAGGHAVLEFSAKWLRRVRDYEPRFLDPDHGFGGSNVPRFDVISQQQLAKMWRMNLPGKTYGQVAYIPTQAWNGLPEGAQPIDNPYD